MNPEHLLKLVEELFSGLWFDCSEYSMNCICSFAVGLGTCLMSRVLCMLLHITLICYGEELFTYWSFHSHQNRPLCALLEDTNLHGCKSLKMTKLGLRHIIVSSTDISFSSTKIFPSEWALLNL
jgi:hypothetical protein